VLKVITVVKTRSRTTLDVARQVAVRLDERFVTLDEKAQKEIAKDPTGYRRSLAGSGRRTENAPDWSPASLEKVLRDLGRATPRGGGKIFHPIRIALTEERCRSL